LTASENFVWLRPSDARLLLALDREAGGAPRCWEFDYRVCPVCKMIQLGEDAEARRRLDESYGGRSKPCGATCLDQAKQKNLRV
jgi:hypothetical protein